MQVAAMEIQKSHLPVVSMKTQTGRVPRNWMAERARNAKCSDLAGSDARQGPSPHLFVYPYTLAQFATSAQRDSGGDRVVVERQ